MKSQTSLFGNPKNQENPKPSTDMFAKPESSLFKANTFTGGEKSFAFGASKTPAENKP